MRNHEINKEKLEILINKYSTEEKKENLINILKNNFSPKYIFHELSDSNMTKEDRKIYWDIIGDYI
ncbi:MULTISPECIES: hypothetical protein [Fusobacterium]|uniref:hypothetical protein n=1 Tax=Fusobacterium TaxID=848 RepID=UPI0025C6046F|nr:hypothetical protein [Fusobacterium sp.]MCI7223124.1 hypothetical protein [Fusobacterium sp.]MDY5306662.1 hypothetical protein [Fusobacterium gastrosuis]MDY5795079.1 hypothetical protein [Fusobacterium gastrosuis]